MAGPAIKFDRPGLEAQLPRYLAGFEQRIARAEAATPLPPDLPRLKRALEEGRFFLDQKNAVQHTLPTLTFANKLTLVMGEREIQVRHHDRAVTPGFEIQLVDWFLHRVYDELAGPLTDAIAPIPPK